jgi:hypothetical protein
MEIGDRKKRGDRNAMGRGLEKGAEIPGSRRGLKTD